MPRRFVTLDVFTGEPLAGNPLAVVLDAEGLDSDRMQAIAREFNLSETAFVLPADDPGHTRRLRIFTPAAELPFAGHPTIGSAVVLAASVFVRNLYCRFLCPLGAALGVLSKLTVFRIKRWSECNTCKICQKTCEWGAIDGPTILMTECVRCDDCERLYLDQQKCPHWRISIPCPCRRSGIGFSWQARP